MLATSSFKINECCYDKCSAMVCFSDKKYKAKGCEEVFTCIKCNKTFLTNICRSNIYENGSMEFVKNVKKRKIKIVSKIPTAYSKCTKINKFKFLKNAQNEC